MQTNVELFIKRDGARHVAFLRPSGGEEISGVLDALPDLPPPGTISPLEYGTRLFQWVFRHDLFRSLKFLQDLSDRRAPGELASLRLLLRLEPDSPLSALAWETMCTSPYALPISVTAAFSRFVRARTPSHSTIWDRPVRILLIVSNPHGLQRFDLDAVDQDLERNIIRAAEERLEGQLRVKRLTRPSLDDIRKQERTGYHITHLLAHATVADGLGGVLLADENGNAVSIGLEEVAAAIASPSDANPPNLVFLALPVSGQPPQGQVLMRLASLLIEAGVQSVVVVKAPVDPFQLKTFMETFYQTLLETGEIDVAMAGARQRMFLEGDPSSWSWAWPVLFTRSFDSRIQRRLPPGLESTVRAIKF